jgi:hypothetical protein
VCGNTFRMLADSRLAPHFSFIGDFSRHYGLFAGCGGELPFGGPSSASAESPQAAAASATEGSCC